MSEQITVIEEWHGDTRTRYTLNADGTRRLLDVVEFVDRPFVTLKMTPELIQWPN